MRRRVRSAGAAVTFDGPASGNPGIVIARRARAFLSLIVRREQRAFVSHPQCAPRSAGTEASADRGTRARLCRAQRGQGEDVAGSALWIGWVAVGSGDSNARLVKQRRSSVASGATSVSARIRHAAAPAARAPRETGSEADRPEGRSVFVGA